MLRLFLCLLLSPLLPGNISHGQTGTLCYFKSADDQWGVRNEKKQVIIPARYRSFDAEDGDTVRGSLIFLVDGNGGTAPGYRTPGIYFDRRGRETVRPYWYDNGPDYIREGLFRFVDRDKIGFADRWGSVVIPATHSYADPFLAGYSFFCDDCSFYIDSTADPEHNLRLAGEQWGLMDTQGRTRLMLSNRESMEITDSLLQRLGTGAAAVFEQPFSKPMTALHRELPGLDSIIASPVVSERPVAVVYKVVEAPRDGFPFFWVAAYYRQDDVYSDANNAFLIHEKTGAVFGYSPGLPGEWEPLSEWVKRFRTPGD